METAVESNHVIINDWNTLRSVGWLVCLFVFSGELVFVCLILPVCGVAASSTVFHAGMVAAAVRICLFKCWCCCCCCCCCSSSSSNDADYYFFFLVLFQAGFKTTCGRQWTMGNFSGATGWWRWCFRHPKTRSRTRRSNRRSGHAPTPLIYRKRRMSLLSSFFLSVFLSLSSWILFFFLSYSFSPLSVVFISLLFANEINTCLTPHFSYRGSWKNRPRLNNGVNDILMHISKDESVDVLRCGWFIERLPFFFSLSIRNEVSSFFSPAVNHGSLHGQIVLLISPVRLHRITFPRRFTVPAVNI